MAVFAALRGVLGLLGKHTVFRKKRLEESRLKLERSVATFERVEKSVGSFQRTLA